MADPYVLNVQRWVNNKFRGQSGYTEIPENGNTGWTTIYALLHGLQITLEVGSTADNFGNGTINAFNAFVRKNGQIKERTAMQDKELQDEYNTAIGDEKIALGKLIDQYEKIHGIIQGALLCKGYAIGTNTPTGNFYAGTANAIKQLREDAGIDKSSSVVTLNIMKALMSMDYFYSYDTSARTKNIQKIQRYLNANYEDYTGLTPCDGVYGRGTNKALIYAIQVEEGMPTSVANGNFGPSTKNCCPTIPYAGVEKDYNGNTYSSTEIGRFAKLVNMGLYANGMGDGNFGTSINTGYLRQFQSKYALPITGIANLTTWLSIFISSGDTSRTAVACDCATILTTEKAQTLYNNGYRYVGRYLSGKIASGASKALSREELQIAFNAGLRVFPIQQASANKVSYFTEEQAVADVNSAYQYATNLGIPRDTVIYFAVDCDPIDTEITSNIIPYFKKVAETMKNSKNSKYKIGIYGTRNVCTRVSDKGYAVRSFVSDMSTGFSGNLGFPIPNNWAFDQFATITVGSGAGQIEIDKDGFSGLDLGINSIVDEGADEPVITPDPDYDVLIGYDTKSPQPVVMVNKSSKSYNVYSSKAENVCNVNPAKQEIDSICDDLGYYPDDIYPVNKWGVTGHKVGEIKPGDLFIWFSCRDHSYDNVPGAQDQVMNQGDSAHKVLFRTSDGIVRYGYIQEVLTASTYNVDDSTRPGKDNFFFNNFNPNIGELRPNGATKAEDLVNVVYDVRRDLQCLDTRGNKLYIISAGSKLKHPGSAGANFNDYMYFSQICESGSTEWHDINPNSPTGNNGGFVSLDMENGVNGYDLALW